MLPSLESGSGCYSRVAENITEPAISNAWHFVVNLIYLHISCATVQTNQWAESPETIFSGQVPIDTKGVRIESNHLFRSI